MGISKVKKLLQRELITKDCNHINYYRLDNLNQALYGIFYETILPTLLRNYDRYSMIKGIEITMPFMDHRLVSYVFSLSYRSKVGEGFKKRIFHDAVAPYLPADIIWRKTKVGFNSPIVDWMQGPLNEWFNDIVSSQKFDECDLLINKSEFKKSIMDITSKANSNFTDASNAWTSLTPLLWQESLTKRVDI